MGLAIEAAIFSKQNGGLGQPSGMGEYFYSAELNAVHPFRDGNGRAQRLFFEHLIINSGYHLSWYPLERNE